MIAVMKCVDREMECIAVVNTHAEAYSCMKDDFAAVFEEEFGEECTDDSYDEHQGDDCLLSDDESYAWISTSSDYDWKIIDCAAVK